MSFDLQKAQDIRQGLSAVLESAAEHYEYRAVKMFPDALDEVERQAKRIAELEAALVEERAKVLYFAHAGDGMYDMDVLEDADHHKTRHLREADEQLRCEGKL